VTEIPKGPAIRILGLAPDRWRPLGRALGRWCDLTFGPDGARARVTADDVIAFDFLNQLQAAAGASVPRNPDDGSARVPQPVAVPACINGPVISVKEAAGLAGISEGFVRRLCRRGRAFSAARPQQSWVIDAGEFTAWAEWRRRKENNGKAG
jgi:hypothetical protein